MKKEATRTPPPVEIGAPAPPPIKVTSNEPPGITGVVSAQRQMMYFYDDQHRVASCSLMDRSTYVSGGEVDERWYVYVERLSGQSHTFEFTDEGEAREFVTQVTVLAMPAGEPVATALDLLNAEQEGRGVSHRFGDEWMEWNCDRIQDDGKARAASERASIRLHRSEDKENDEAGASDGEPGPSSTS